jgi:alkylation response protein AidB-like acyl-CoA dehydrogenase
VIVAGPGSAEAEAREEFRRSVRAFVNREVLPGAEDLDQHGVFPRRLFERMGQLGYFGIRYPEDAGGQGADFATACVMYEELAAGSLSLAAICAMQSLMGTHFVFRFGTPQHHDEYLRPALRGEKVATFALTEANAGSDLGAMTTRAERTGDGWVLRGAKTWITNAPVADFLTVGAKTSDEPGLKNIALFLVDARNPGYWVGRPIEKLGIRSSLTSEIGLDDCEVPAEALLGGEGDGVRNVGSVLSEIRAMTAALAVGLARRALTDAARYATDREAFGKPIGKFQAIEHKLADMATDLEAARLMAAESAARIDAGDRSVSFAAMAKLFATEACARIVDEGTRIHGSYGFAMEYPAQRYFRDARFLLYGGGTSELLRGLIGREVLKAAGA